MLNLLCNIQNSHPKCVAVSFSIPMDDGIVSKGKADQVELTIALFTLASQSGLESRLTLIWISVNMAWILHHSMRSLR